MTYITQAVTREMNGVVSQIRDQIKLMETAQEYGFDPGPNGKGYCIFCKYQKDRTLYVSEDDQYFKCHHAGCEAKGDIFTLVMLAEGVDFPTAVDKLARKAGLPVVIDPNERAKLQVESDRAEALEKFANFAHSQMTPEANAYVQSRGITEQYAEEHKIGFIRPGARFSGDANDLALLQAAGLLQPGGVGSEKWCNRIIFFFRAGGQIIYFVGRAINESVQPRLLNPSLEEIGPKPVVRSRISNEIWLTEGVFGFATLDQAGKPVMAILGGASPSKLPPKVKKAVLGFDNDSAGVNFTLKFGLEFYNQGKHVEVLILPQGPGIKDIDDCLTRGISIDSLERRDFVEWAISMMKSGHSNFEAAVFLMLAQMAPLDAEKYLRSVKKETGLDLTTIRAQVKFTKQGITKGATVSAREPWVNERGQIIPPELATYLMRDYHFIYSRKKMFVYKDGVFAENAEDLVDHLTAETIKNKYRRNIADEVIAYIKAVNKVADIKLDSMINIINLKNGVIDLFQPGFPFLPHDPSYLSSIQIPTCYDPNAECPEFDEFLRQVLPEDTIDLVWEIIGYSLILHNSLEKAFLLHGPSTTNGKSTLLNVLTALLGTDNVAAESLGDLEGDKFKTYNLIGKLLNIYADLPKLNLKEIGIFKSLVSGDRTSVQGKFLQSFPHGNKAKLIFSCNERPNVQDPGPEYFRRLIIIPFPVSFEGREDRTLGERLIKPSVLSGILNKGLRGLHRLLINGHYSESASCRKELEEYKGSQDPVQQFIIEFGVAKSNRHSLRGQDLFDRYAQWARRNNIKPGYYPAFCKRIKALLDPEEKRASNIRMWLLEYSAGGSKAG